VGEAFAGIYANGVEADTRFYQKSGTAQFGQRLFGVLSITEVIASFCLIAQPNAPARSDKRGITMQVRMMGKHIPVDDR
jgi:hypothetical protein